MASENRQIELGERIASMEGEMKHLATKDFVRALIENQTKDLNETIREQTKELRQEVQGVKSWQNRITGGGAALGLIVSLAVAIGNIVVIVSRVP